MLRHNVNKLPHLHYYGAVLHVIIQHVGVRVCHLRVRTLETNFMRNCFLL